MPFPNPSISAIWRSEASKNDFSVGTHARSHAGKIVLYECEGLLLLKFYN